MHALEWAWRWESRAILAAIARLSPYICWNWELAINFGGNDKIIAYFRSKGMEVQMGQNY